MFRKSRSFLSKTNWGLFYYKSVKFKHQWIAPEGYDTGIKIYSRIADKNVPFIVLNKNFVKWYICGPTVYDVSHVGHASVFVRNDILSRILRHFFQINPVIAVSVTDMDDKIIRQAYKLGVDCKSLTKRIELDFLQQLKDLNVSLPMFTMRVTDHIPDIIEFITRIVEKGKGYPASDGSVYYEKAPNEMWKLIDPFEPKEDILKPGQKSSADFALWKGAKTNEPFWDSPWGEGRPGWHIECSAMASKIFGSKVDVHSGGIDLVFPHHENEEVQSCCYHDCQQWVNYWLHTGQLSIDKEKMSKSLYNFVTVTDFLKENTANEFRMYCFMTKYRHALHYSSASMNLPRTSCKMIMSFLADARSYVKGNWTRGNISEAELLQELHDTNNEVIEHLKNDLDTGKCYWSLLKLIKNTVKKLNEESEAPAIRCPAAVAAVSQYVDEIFKVFGFQFEAVSSHEQSENLHKMEFILDEAVKFRSQIRAETLPLSDKSTKQNILKLCDSFRDELKTIGVDIKDLDKNNSSWSFKNEKIAEEKLKTESGS